jgi:hypothetical protein
LETCGTSPTELETDFALFFVSNRKAARPCERLFSIDANISLVFVLALVKKV